MGSEFGYTITDFRKRAQNKRTTEESHIILKGGTSWKEDLREVIEEAKRSSSTQEEFIAHLQKYGVTLARNGKDYSYLHPEKKKPIRGAKLGENYTKQEILNVIGKQGNGNGGYAFNGDRRNQSEKRQVSGDDGQSVVTRSVGDIEREMQRLDRQAEYAHHGLDGESEERKRLERAERERLERERIERRKRDEELARRNENAEQNDSNGNKSGKDKLSLYVGLYS